MADETAGNENANLAVSERQSEGPDRDPVSGLLRFTLVGVLERVRVEIGRHPRGLACSELKTKGLRKARMCAEHDIQR